MAGSLTRTPVAPPPESGFRTFDITLGPATVAPVAYVAPDAASSVTSPASEPAATPEPVPDITLRLAPTPTPTPTPTPRPTPPPAPGRTITGYATWYDAGKTALRLPYGTRVRICGNGGCIDRTVTDYGPASWTGRVADLMPADFRSVCGCSTSAGVTYVTVYIL